MSLLHHPSPYQCPIKGHIKLPHTTPSCLSPLSVTNLHKKSMVSPETGMLIPFSMTLGSPSPYSTLPSYTVPYYFTFNSTPNQFPFHFYPSLDHRPTNHSTSIFFFQSCQGFRPHPASSWPSSEVPSSSNPVFQPCPVSMVLCQSTHWPIGHFLFTIGPVFDSTWPGGHCFLKSVC